MRPRFSLEVPLEPPVVHQRFAARLACTGCPCRAEVRGAHIEVMIRDDLRHYWSPRLSLEVGPHPGGSQLHGLFGPNPEVWTLFLAAYAFLILSALFAGVLGCVQLVLGMPPWGLWLTGGCLAACLLPYLGSLIGQRLAAEQMDLLRCFLEESLGLEHVAVASSSCPPEASGGRSLPVVEGRS